MVVRSWNHVFSCVQATEGVLNMVVPSWNHVFLRVQATQGGIEHGGPELEPRVFTCPGHPGNHVFSRVQGTQGGI